MGNAACKKGIPARRRLDTANRQREAGMAGGAEQPEKAMSHVNTAGILLC